MTNRLSKAANLSKTKNCSTRLRLTKRAIITKLKPKFITLKHCPALVLLLNCGFGFNVSDPKGRKGQKEEGADPSALYATVNKLKGKKGQNEEGGIPVFATPDKVHLPVNEEPVYSDEEPEEPPPLPRRPSIDEEPEEPEEPPPLPRSIGVVGQKELLYSDVTFSPRPSKPVEDLKTVIPTHSGVVGHGQKEHGLYADLEFSPPPPIPRRSPRPSKPVEDLKTVRPKSNGERNVKRGDKKGKKEEGPKHNIFDTYVEAIKSIFEDLESLNQERRRKKKNQEEDMERPFFNIYESIMHGQYNHGKKAILSSEDIVKRTDWVTVLHNLDTVWKENEKNNEMTETYDDLVQYIKKIKDLANGFWINFKHKLKIK